MVYSKIIHIRHKLLVQTTSLTLSSVVLASVTDNKQYHTLEFSVIILFNITHMTLMVTSGFKGHMPLVWYLLMLLTAVQYMLTSVIQEYCENIPPHGLSLVNTDESVIGIQCIIHIFLSCIRNIHQNDRHDLFLRGNLKPLETIMGGMSILREFTI